MHKEACELRIQELFNHIEPHWNRMAVDQGFMDAFFDINRGSGESAILAVCCCVKLTHYTDEQYEAELERVLELRRASLSTFMLAVRTEIEGLWVELMMSDEEKDEFIGFIDGECVRFSSKHPLIPQTTIPRNCSKRMKNIPNSYEQKSNQKLPSSQKSENGIS